jgi:hypothetical protein
MQVQKAALYDFLFCCSDRHSQNVFVDEHANLKLIDNDLLLGGAQRGRDGKGSCSPRWERPLTRITRIPCVADHCVCTALQRRRLWHRPAVGCSEAPRLSAVGVRACLNTARCSSRAT